MRQFIRIIKRKNKAKWLCISKYIQYSMHSQMINYPFIIPNVMFVNRMFDILGNRFIQKFLKLFTVFSFLNYPRLSGIPGMLFRAFSRTAVYDSLSPSQKSKKKFQTLNPTIIKYHSHRAYIIHPIISLESPLLIE